MDIQTMRGALSRAQFAERVGVGALTVYRWELPEGAPESRRPRGKVLARLLAFADSEAGGGATVSAAAAPLAASEGGAGELESFGAAITDIDECRLGDAEAKLVSVLSSGSVQSDAGRTLAAALLARLQLLVRHDTKGAFATLSGATSDVTRLPPAVQLEYHLTASYLYAHADAQLFNPGKSHHHAALATALLGEGSGDPRFFVWYTQYLASVSLYDIALIARAAEGLPAVRALATTPLHRCLAAEATAVASLGLTNAAEVVRRLEELDALAARRGLPLQQLHSATWRAQALVEQAAPPKEILALLERAEQIQRDHRIANGIHTLLLKRNQGEALLRIGDLAAAESVLLHAERVAREIAYTPIRIHTTLAGLYVRTQRLEELRRVARDALAFDDVQKDITRAFGEVLTLLCDAHAASVAPGACESLLGRLEALRRLGVWPAAYRQVALLALSVVAPRGDVGGVERLVGAVDSALQAAPSSTATAVFRWYRAILLTRRGRFVEARHGLDAACATLEASGDRIEVASIRHGLAHLALLEGAPDAEALLARSEHALHELGLPTPAPLRSDAVGFDDAPPPHASPGAADALVERLVVPLQRLATRGVGDSLLQKELLNVTSELFSERAVWLEEIDANGASLELGRRDGTEAAGPVWLDIADGLGRRLRLGVGGALSSAERAALELLVSTASLAFEVAALRALPASGMRAPAVEADRARPSGFVAASASMRRLEAELGRLSRSRATIIINGESGTGKEVVARAIHDLSQRAGGPYVTFNSAAVPRELFEGQLFGHKKGAFTGATSDQPGVIRSAQGGTLFLDEIGELPLDVQPKLLRFLENGEVLPVGGREPLRVDVRVIAATHRDLRALVRDGKFREDLYYRLQVVPVELAPLRDRPEDIVPLAKHFLAKLTPEGAPTPALTADAEARLLAHPWPGNVRELRNVVERSMAFDPLPRFLTAAHLHVS